MIKSFGDVGTIVDLAQKVDTQPLRLSGRLLGLSGDEQAAMPSWAGVTGAFLVGAAVGWVLWPHVLRKRARAGKR